MLNDSRIIQRGGKSSMSEPIMALLIGSALAIGSFLLISLLNERYTRREKTISHLLLKRAKKD
jgi:hypothetical protein